MKLCLVHPVFWPSFLVLWTLQVTEGNNQDVCQDKKDHYPVTHEEENFRCLLYPTNVLNCSWSFYNLHKDVNFSAYISVCHGETLIPSLSQSSNERVGSRSLTVQWNETLLVILQFDMSLHGKSEVKTHKYELDRLEVQPPPSNVSATVKDGKLLVTWSPPTTPTCLEYELDLGDQESLKHFNSLVSYTEPNADPSHTYRVKVRTRKSDNCIGSAQWSEWSPTVTVERSFYEFNTLLIILISLGIPMILLAVLLLVRQQRVSELLFPPIPRPPPKYKYFLEKTDMFSFSHPTMSPKAEEEITKVEDTQ
ncbi:hypothetical protein INR49_000340 [Caranx melampygus]|nr:hypothetical protein INR49_000340 [Caranx melampygus]